MNDHGKRLFGKYRGVVVDTADPMAMGRIRVRVPDIGGADTMDWAMPCVPIAGPHSGMVAVPPAGASVWVEFEGGDPGRPIWVGGFWDGPTLMPVHGRPLHGFAFAVETPRQGVISISDLPGPDGGIVLRSGGASLRINETGIHVENGQGASITLIGPAVSVNQGALEVI